MDKAIIVARWSCGYSIALKSLSGHYNYSDHKIADALGISKDLFRKICQQYNGVLQRTEGIGEFMNFKKPEDAELAVQDLMPYVVMAALIS